MKPINNLNTLHFLFPTLKLLRLIEGFTAELTTSREGCACTHAHTHKEFAEAARWEVTWFKTVQGSAPARCYTALPSQDLLSTCQDSATCNFQAFRKLPSNPKIPKDYCYGYWRKKKKKKSQVCYNCFSRRFSCCSGSLLAPCHIMEQIFVEAVVESQSRAQSQRGGEGRDHLPGETGTTSSRRDFAENTGKPHTFG